MRKRKAEKRERKQGRNKEKKKGWIKRKVGKKRRKGD